MLCKLGVRMRVECVLCRCKVEFVVFIIYNRAVDPQMSGGCIICCNFLLLFER